MRRKTLREFFSDHRMTGLGAFIYIPEFKGYIFGKIGNLFIDGEARKFFMIGQISRQGRNTNGALDRNHSRTGLLRPMLDHIETVSNEYGCDICLYSVINEFLPDVLLRYGFKANGVERFYRLREWKPALENGPPPGGSEPSPENEPSPEETQFRG